MPRPGWAGSAELEWLDKKISRFRVAQSSGKIPTFKKKIWQEYFDHFYPDLTTLGTDAENTIVQLLNASKVPEDGNSVTVKKRMDWVQRAPKKAGKMHPYQAFWALNNNKVMNEARNLAAAYSARIDAGENLKAWESLSFAIEAMMALLDEATDEVKEAVEEYRNKHKASDLSSLDMFLDPDADPGAAERHKHAKKVQSAIEGLPKVLTDLLDQIDKQMG
ncbi:hypothetical protein GSI_14888 [Ganoderma sinense ZZ0214-1]|uniref:Uncharacterized protein n=1 Tax=Ganoderma sinense ZZ0214-1 TaxID=1077348 RepID=A0A2G8RPY0_9APHY|nr:hypothetical protein GSI_14888 [Ganoderma sinense ZZ0214-1]